MTLDEAMRRAGHGQFEAAYEEWLANRASQREEDIRELMLREEREEDHAASRYEEQRPNHVFVLVYLDGHDVFASCSCEWTSEVTKSSTAAERLAEGHAREVGDL